MLRDGRIKSSHPFDLVVGDILILNAGDIIPVDGIVTQSSKLRVDETNLAGLPHKNIIKKLI